MEMEKYGIEMGIITREAGRVMKRVEKDSIGLQVEMFLQEAFLKDFKTVSELTKSTMEKNKEEIMLMES